MQKKSLIVILAVLAVLGAQCLAADQLQTQPLFTYVNQPDSSYAWSKASETKLENGATLIKVDMTSQTWQKIVWKHELSIVMPKELRDGSTVGVMFDFEGANNWIVGNLANAANLTGMPLAYLDAVPNEPLWDKWEDDLLSYTLSKALETNDLTWPLLFPMTKSVVRAMDAIQALAKKEWKAPVKGFVVSGASKRGWTTWLTGAVDKRVVGIAPSVYDNLNLPAQMEQQMKDYGKYSEAISEYTDKALPEFTKTPEGRVFAAMIDPYTFRKLLTMPKMILLGTNDPYWTLESPNLYFRDLPGDNHIHYTPNGGHVYIEMPDVAQALSAFALACSKGEKLPKMTWTYVPKLDGLQLTIRPGKDSQAVRAWTASSETKDFRQAKWTAQTIEGKSGVYTFTLPRPKSGFSALFGEADYKEGDVPYTQDTTPRIWGAK
jgi:PhoPQ-activated pathogenicity-related protein